MNFKKNAGSYVLWLIYTITVGAVILGITASVFAYAGFPWYIGPAVGGGCLLLLCGMTVAFSLIKKRQVSRSSDRKTAGAIVEGLLFTGLFAAGICLRVMQILNHPEVAGGILYFDTAEVTGNWVIPRVLHSGTYLYLYLIRCALQIFGNRAVVALWLQAGLQLTAGVLFYFAVRRFTGVVSAVVSFVFWMLSPYVIGSALELGPSMFVLLAYAAALIFLGMCVRHTERRIIPCVLAGLLVGAVCYLDVFGITLFLFAGAVLVVEKKDLLSGRILVLAALLLGAMIGFFGCVLADALLSDIPYINVIAAWYLSWKPHGFSIPADMSWGGLVPDIVAMAVLLGLGIFTFWCRRKQERHGIWILASAALIAMLGFGMLDQNVGSGSYLYLFLAVLAGVGAGELFAPAQLVGQEEAQVPGADVQVVVEAQVPKELPVTEELPVSDAADEKKESEKNKPEIQFIENPLPLPKKHQPRSFEYPINDLDEQDDFDVEISSADDFDR